MATFTERLSLLIDAKTGGAIREIQSLNSAVDKTGTAQTQTATKTSFLTQQMHNLGLTGSATGAMLQHAAGVAAVAGMGALVAATKQGIDKQLELADSVRKVVAVSGLSAEQSSRLVEVTGDYGIAASTTERALLRLGTQVNNNKNFEEQYGVAIQRNKDGTPDLIGTLENVQKAYKGSGDQAEKNAMLMGIFGRAGKELIPVLRETGSLAEALSQVPESRILSDTDLRNARAYSLAMDDLHDVMDAFQRELAMAVIPTITTTVEALNGMFEAINTLANPVGGLGSALNYMMMNISPLGPGFQGLAAASDLFKGHFVDATEHALRMVPLAGTGVAELGRAVGIFGGSSKDIDKVTEAQNRYQDAVAKVQSLVGQNKDAELAAAKKELHAAQKDLANSTTAVADAMKNENEKNQEAITLAYQRLGLVLGLESADLAYAAAQDNVKEAHLKVADAQGKVFAAEQNLEKARQEGGEGSMEYAQAQRDLEEAHLDLSAAQRGVAQSDIQLVQSGLAVENQVKSLKDQVKQGKLSYDDYQAKITELKAKYPELGTAIDNATARVKWFHGEVDGVPKAHDTTFTASDAVTGVANGAKWSIGTVPSWHHTDFTATDFVTGVVNNIKWGLGELGSSVGVFLAPKKQHGGPIPGGANQPYPIIAHGGEYVLSADVVDRIKRGAQSRGASADGGRPWTGSLAADGSTGGGRQLVIPITLTMDGEVVTDVVVRRVSDRSRGGPVFPASSVMTRG